MKYSPIETIRAITFQHQTFYTVYMGSSILAAFFVTGMGSPEYAVGVLPMFAAITTIGALESPNSQIIIFPIPFPVKFAHVAAFLAAINAYGITLGSIASSVYIAGCIVGYCWLEVSKKRGKPFRFGG
eukprot:NODE_11159_length_469_cov_23.358382_g10504_i0.p1 GENE.NODE_11159_length_469_cov_23.358382_g10504_i0~~NODE_11159_length_469_cov_23.358382_g10504_i0.p1  ORF type:complete len:144 (-),score=28.46 NODE_11159_length_469_cov_23.358382_g10504_i0:37-420(-)